MTKTINYFYIGIPIKSTFESIKQLITLTSENTKLLSFSFKKVQLKIFITKTRRNAVSIVYSVINLSYFEATGSDNHLKLSSILGCTIRRRCLKGQGTKILWRLLYCFVPKIKDFMKNRDVTICPNLRLLRTAPKGTECFSDFGKINLPIVVRF